MKLRNSGKGEWECVSSLKTNVSVLRQKQECGKMRSRCGDSLREAGRGRGGEEEEEGCRGQRAKYSQTCKQTLIYGCGRFILWFNRGLALYIQQR